MDKKPLIEIIAMMEINGCKIDNNQLESLTKQFSERISLIEKKIFTH